MSAIVIGLIKAYRYLISPFFPPSCRFTPTCSEYAIEAVREHGVSRGVWMGTKRICRCHPLGHSGYDPVPPKSPESSNRSDVSTLKLQ
ncbi:MAG: membrane protein insertion efficiency factor YidD [Pseudomonadota bacterium]